MNSLIAPCLECCYVNSNAPTGGFLHSKAVYRQPDTNKPIRFAISITYISKSYVGSVCSNTGNTINNPVGRTFNERLFIMSDETPRITEANIPSNGFLIVKLCLLCDDVNNDSAEPFPIPFSTLNMAKAIVKAQMEDIQDDPDGYVKGNVVHVKNDGKEHQYIQAIVKVTNEVVWRPGEDAQIEAKFNDIINGINLDNTTE